LNETGFHDDKIGLTPKAERAFVTVQADGRHAEAAARVNKEEAQGVQNVAR
jgi:hypothetical protein